MSVDVLRVQSPDLAELDSFEYPDFASWRSSQSPVRGPAGAPEARPGGEELVNQAARVHHRSGPASTAARDAGERGLAWLLLAAVLILIIGPYVVLLALVETIRRAFPPRVAGVPQ